MQCFFKTIFLIYYNVREMLHNNIILNGIILRKKLQSIVHAFLQLKETSVNLTQFIFFIFFYFFFIIFHAYLLKKARKNCQVYIYNYILLPPGFGSSFFFRDYLVFVNFNFIFLVKLFLYNLFIYLPVISNHF